jgi:hypothetical protein
LVACRVLAASQTQKVSDSGLLYLGGNEFAGCLQGGDQDREVAGRLLALLLLLDQESSQGDGVCVHFGYVHFFDFFRIFFYS